MTCLRRVSGATGRGCFAWLGLTLLLLAVGCSGDPDTVVLTLVSPGDGAVLTLDDDADDDAEGVQVTVAVESKGMPQGTTIEVQIDGDTIDEEGRLDARGDAEIGGVTLPPGEHTIRVRTSTGAARSDEHSYRLKVLEITAPEDGAELNGSDDADPATPGVQVDVTVQSHGLDDGEEVALRVDGGEVDSVEPDEDGVAHFTNVTLDDGTRRLRATAGSGDELIESAQIEVRVESVCAEVDFVSPSAPSSGTLVLGGDGSCPGGDDPFEVEVRISTDAGNGRPIKLFVNEQEVASSTVDGTSAVFSGIALPRRDDDNTLQVEVENREGITCKVDYPAPIRVDCAGPSCEIVGPNPLTVTEGSSMTHYLNAAMRGADGYVIDVETTGDAVGNPVNLIVDGRVRDALATDAVSVDGGGAAQFTVDLAEGAHTIEVQCRDDLGNVTSSGEATWTVDTVPCTVDVTDPSGTPLLVTADDEDTATAGVQLTATSTIGGSGCVEQRAAVCDPSAGISGESFEDYDGTSPLASVITLDPATIDQSLCVEIRDAAQNVAIGSTDVQFRESGDAPRLRFESPTTGDRFNALGGGGYVADAIPASAACEANFVIACSEVGSDVELYFISQTPGVDTPFATGDCVADASAPSGFAGRAQFQAAFGDGDQTSDILAYQRVIATSGAMLGGVSARLTLEGDCVEPRALLIGDPCEELGSGQITIAEAADRDIQLSDVTADIATATLRVTDASATVQDLSPTTSSANQATFEAVNLGGVGTAMLEATVVDDFDNVATDTCSVEIVDDLPGIVSYDLPADLAQYGPGDSCDTGTPGEYGVRVMATIDSDQNRDVTIRVDGVDVATGVSVSGAGVIDTCVPVPVDTSKGSPGPSAVMLLVESTVGSGMAFQTHTVSVSSIRIDLPTDDEVLDAGDNCAGAGFGAVVRFTVDIMHDGGTVDLSATTGGVQNGIAVNVVSGRSVTVDSPCLDLAADVDEEGPNLITATVSSTSINDTVNVVVVSSDPTNAIVIDDLAAPELDDAAHRTGAVVTWPMPTENWTGQLESYEMRCRAVQLTEGDPDKEAWWDAVISMDGNAAETLPVDLTPDDADPSARLAYRPLQRVHCVVRAYDAVGNPTPILRSTDVTLPLRQQVIASGAGAGSLGFAVSAVGDVDGDAIDDILVGGLGEAALIFGTTSGFSGAADVSFTAAVSGVAGRNIAGLGDFDGDGLNDFAIADHDYNSTQGRTIVFYGRPQGAWPANVDLEAEPCPGDLCITHTGALARSGRVLSSAGNFDDAGPRDILIGAPWANSFAGEAFIVLGDAYHRRTCDDVGDCRASGEACEIDAGAPGGSQTYCQLDGQTFWQLVAQIPSGDWVTAYPADPPGLRGFQVIHPTANEAFAAFGTALGEFDGSSGDDVLLANFVTTEVLQLNGRAWSGAGAAFNVLDPGTELTVVADGAAARLVALGDVIGLSGAIVSDKIDIAVTASVTDNFTLFRGETGPDVGDVPFDVDDDVFFSGPGTNIGEAFAAGYWAGEDVVLGDLDGDGTADLLVGTRTNQAALFWYHDQLEAAAAGGGTVAATTAASIPIGVSGCPDASCVEDDAATAELIVQYVGDVDGDGHLDIVLGDYRAGSGDGRTVLLY